jgi:hypothetical protein
MPRTAQILDFVEFRRIRRPQIPSALPSSPLPAPSVVWIPVWVVLPMPAWRPA